jgi:type 1 glutamine amidotransferase
MMPPKRRIFLGLFLPIIFNLIGVFAVSAEPTKHIVLIAGAKSHGPGEHEYLKSIKLLKALLDRAPNLKGLQTDIYFNGWPDDQSVLDHADTIAILSDGEDGSKSFHAPFMTNVRMKILEKQIKRGCGFMTFHFSTFAPAEYASQILDWNGGYFDWQTGHGEGGFFGVTNDTPHQRWHSAIRVLDADVELGTPLHPISEGISSVHFKDEFYYQLTFRESDSRLKPILRVQALSPTPRDQIVAWALERKDGGRGFGTTTGHYFNNWQNDNYRKLILNALVWTAGMSVPKGGVDSAYMREGEVDRALITKPIHTLYVSDRGQTESERKESADVIATALNSELPRFQVEVADAVPFEKDLSRYKLIVMNNCDAIRWSLRQTEKNNLLRFLKTGGGLAIVTTAKPEATKAVSPSTAEWAEDRNICKDVDWGRAEENGNVDEKNMSDVIYRISLPEKNHPITKSMDDYDVRRIETKLNMSPVLDFTLRDDRRIRILASAANKNTSKPIAFILPYKKARIYQLIAGHDVTSILLSPKMAQFVRYGSLWAAGR